MTCIVACLMGSFVVYRFLYVVAAVKKYVGTRAKQVEVPVFFLTVGVLRDVAGDIARHLTRLAIIHKVSSVVPAP